MPDYGDQAIEWLEYAYQDRDGSCRILNQRLGWGALRPDPLREPPTLDDRPWLLVVAVDTVESVLICVDCSCPTRIHELQWTSFPVKLIDLR